MANRKIEVQILGDSSSLERAFSRSSQSARKFNVGIGTLVKSAVVFRAVREGLDAVGAAVGGSIREFSQQQKVAAQTNAVLKSTGSIANVTAKRVDRVANSIQRYSGIDDEAVKAGENLLLTFKNVRNEVGKGNAIFDRATKSAVDLSVAGFGSLDSTSKQLGKALNDPIKGMTALGRAGVTFTQSQRDTIKALVESNRTLDAQKLILREVESQVGGSARAFGETIPGALARTSEAFKNMGGAIVGAVAPAVAGMAQTVADVLPRIEAQVAAFVDRLQDAKTLSAKIDVVIDTVGDVTSDIADTIGAAVSRVDWDEVWAQARNVGDGLQARLEEIDFGFIGKRIGDGIASAVRVAIPAAKDLAERISNAISAIDFEELGKKLGPGLAAAVVTAFVTLADPAFWVRNWDLALAVAFTVFRAKIVTLAGKLLAPLAKLGGDIVLRIGVGMLDAMPRLGAILIAGLARLPALAAKALSPLTSLVARRFARLGKLARFTVTVLGIQAAINAVVGFAKRVGGVFSRLGNAISGALDRAWDSIVRRASIAALRIVEPFTHLPGFFGSKFRDAKEAMQEQLAGMETAAAQTAGRIQGSIDSIKGKKITVAVEVISKGGLGDEAGRGVVRGERLVGGSPLGSLGKVVTDQARQAQEAADARAAAAKKAAAARIAAAKAITVVAAATAAAAEKAAAIARAVAERAQTAFDSLMDSLNLKLERAQVTRGLKDDLAALKHIENAIQTRIKAEGRTTDLARQLFQNRQAQASVLAQQRNANQFEALGLTATGEKRTPGAGALLKRAGNLKNLIKGTLLDTAKTRSQLTNIGKVLSGKFGAVGKEIRDSVLQMLNDTAGALDQGTKQGPLTKTTSLNSKKLLAGLGLSPEEIRAFRGRLSSFNSAGLAPAGFQTTGGTQTTGGFTGGPLVVESHTTINLDGQKIASVVTRNQQKRRRRNPQQKRGPNRIGGV